MNFSEDLSSVYDLKYHRIYWEATPDSHFIKGSIASYFVSRVDSLHTIIFHLDSSMVVDSVVFHSQLLKFEFTGAYELSIYLPVFLSKSVLDSITVYYHGWPKTGGFGSFSTGTHQGSPVLWTLSEPYGAADWWPCKQSLNDKIDSVDIFINTIWPNKAASNGILVSTKRNRERVTYHWKHKYPIAAYLIAMAITNYAEYTDSVITNNGSFPILNYVYPEDSALFRQDAERTVDVMKFFINTFGPYPFEKEKYGHAQFGRGGGMEHQTMSFMGSLSEYLVVHELAHQWFGDKITCHSWSDIWLNEGFATYSEGLWTEYRYGAEAFADWREMHIGRIIRTPGGSVYVYNQDTLLVGRVFDYRLTYEKAAMVIHMLRKILGDEVFFRALKNYLSDSHLAYHYARTNDLIYHMEKESGEDLTRFFDDWIYGQGYPVFHIKWLQNGELFRVEVNQSSAGWENHFFRIPVPLYLAGGSQDTLVILNPSSNDQTFYLTIPFKVDTVIFDKDFDFITGSNKVEGYCVEPQNKITVYPNPVHHLKNLFIVVASGESIETVSIIDLSGKIVYYQDYNKYYFNAQSWKELSVPYLAPGIYLIAVKTKSGWLKTRLVSY